MSNQTYEIRKIEPVVQEVKSAIKMLTVDSPQAYDLHWNPNSYVKVECHLGNIHLKSNSPTFSYYVCLCDTGVHEASDGWLYAGLKGKKSPIIDAMEIYKIKELIIKINPTSLNPVVQDGLKVALLIDHHFHAVFDFEGRKGYCRTGCSHTGNFGFKLDHKWSDAALKHFVKNPDAIVVPPKPPSAKEKQKEFIKTYLKPTLKDWGYQTSGQLWWKDRGDFFVIISLANSSYNLADHVLFWFDITLALTSKLSDPAKKKPTAKDMIDRNINEWTYLSKDRREHAFRDSRYIHLKEDTNLSEFIVEMKKDFENDILPCLEKLQTLNDWAVFYETSQLWNASFIKERILGPTEPNSAEEKGFLSLRFRDV